MTDKIIDQAAFNHAYPSSGDLQARAKERMPRFAYQYLSSGAMAGAALKRNRSRVQSIKLEPHYLKTFNDSDTSVDIFGKQYAAPFGIAPIGLQGLMWPNAPEILAKAALRHNIPYVLSTVSTQTLEHIAAITEGSAWYQLYNPTLQTVRDDVLARLKQSGYQTIVMTVDVPTFGYRYRDYQNGLTLPPKHSIRNIMDAVKCPEWVLKTLKHGIPKFKNLERYIDEKINPELLTTFMNTMAMGGVAADNIKEIRDKWHGNLVIKGVMSEFDISEAITLGADGVVVSNHGARQLDAGHSPIDVLQRLPKHYYDNIVVMTDSGLRNGGDIAAVLALGARFAFLGRTFMYGVAALGDAGGEHTIAMLKAQFTQTMKQIRCEKVTDLPTFLSSYND